MNELFQQVFETGASINIKKVGLDIQIDLDDHNGRARTANIPYEENKDNLDVIFVEVMVDFLNG